MVDIPSRWVDCSKHGKSAAITVSEDGKPVGIYCFKCIAEWIDKHFKNYLPRVKG